MTISKLQGWRRRFEMTVISSILSQNTAVPSSCFMKLRIFVSVTWLNYRIPTKIYLNYHFPAQKIVKYRILWYRTPTPYKPCSQDCLRYMGTHDDRSIHFIEMKEACKHKHETFKWQSFIQKYLIFCYVLIGWESIGGGVEQRNLRKELYFSQTVIVEKSTSCISQQKVA